MAGSLVTLEVDGSPMETYVSLPGRADVVPMVVVAQHRLGLDGFMRRVCDRLADAGFAAAAPDLYHRSWDKAQFDDVTSLPRGHERAEAAIVAMSGKATNDQTSADMEAAIGHLADLPSVARSQLGVMGFCGGGRVAYMMATRLSGLKATALFYPGSVFAQREDGRSAFDASDRIACPVLGLFGNNDQNPSPDDVARMDQEFKRLGVEHEFHAYDDVAHAFMDPTNTNGYSDAVEADAWAKLTAFLTAWLKG